MGLDLTLGVIILIAAFRGWFQGFVSQAVRIAGLVACVYLAEPVRDYAKPYVLPYLPDDPARAGRPAALVGFGRGDLRRAGGCRDRWSSR